MFSSFFLNQKSSEGIACGTYVFIADKEVKTAQVLCRDLKKSVVGPFTEPIDCGTVDESRIHPQTVPEGVSYRTHAERNMQVGPDALDEIPMDCLEDSCNG